MPPATKEPRSRRINPSEVSFKVRTGRLKTRAKNACRSVINLGRSKSKSDVLTLSRGPTTPRLFHTPTAKSSQIRLADLKVSIPDQNLVDSAYSLVSHSRQYEDAIPAARPFVVGRISSLSTTASQHDDQDLEITERASINAMQRSRRSSLARTMYDLDTRSRNGGSATPGSTISLDLKKPRHMPSVRTNFNQDSLSGGRPISPESSSPEELRRSRRNSIARTIFDPQSPAEKKESPLPDVQERYSQSNIQLQNFLGFPEDQRKFDALMQSRSVSASAGKTRSWVSDIGLRRATLGLWIRETKESLVENRISSRAGGARTSLD